MRELLDGLLGRTDNIRLTLTDGRILTGTVHTPVGHTYPGVFTFLDTQESEVVHIAVSHVVTARLG
ncbi:hypothetical protein CH293_02985 [Rhodococcus sp. 14-2470-1b]|uniref:hypothetical protein n=1 Tax=Rhodococcus sp. 14-2470-1b TaxID=2023149 RepID=UPI000B9A8E19|nr:hypothetical protein [Rhodococcus sp. 14-2470-1b]OZF57690.1 hypothetical protein CH293_02985 [Rhodococcus sp. 14-2470-1b]